MPDNIDEQIKIAQREKLLAETKKLELERERIDIDNEAVKKEAKKRWYKKEKFPQQFVSIFIGITILGFYINYIIVPTSSINNLKLELENQRKEKSLFEKENQIEKDSLKYEELIKSTDSLRLNLATKNNEIIALAKERESLDSAMKELIKNYENGSNNLQNKIANTKQLLILYKEKEELIVYKIDAIREILKEARASKTISSERAKFKFLQAYDLLPDALRKPSFKETVNKMPNFETQVEFLDSFFKNLNY